jgi:hypothetical protein
MVKSNRWKFRLSSLLWLVAIAAAFLAGVRYGEYRTSRRAGAPEYIEYVEVPISQEQLGPGEVYTISHRSRGSVPTEQ